LAVTREKSDSGAEEIPLQQESETEERGAVEQSSKKLSYLGYIILPNVGLMHRVRIRGYASAAAARADAERLNKEEGLDSIVLTLELD
jgi:hypothetical protein